MSSPLDTEGMVSSAESWLTTGDDGSSSGFDKPDGVYFSETSISSYCFEPHTRVTEDWETLRQPLVNFHGQPVGTIAASDDSSEELNYDQAFSARRQNYFLPSLTSDSESWMTSAKRRKIDSHTPPSVTRIVTVKATFNNDVIKFNFPVSSGLLNLKNIVAQRFEIKSNRFCLKYIDKEKDLILIAIDEDLKLAIDTTAVNNCFNLICVPDGVCAHELIQPALEFVADNFTSQIYSSDSKSLVTTGFDDVSEKTHHGKKRKTESDLLPPVTGLVTANITYNKVRKVFQLSISLGITNLENEVARSFKLKGKKLRLKYWDEDDDLILVACDVDLKLAVVTTGSNNNTIDLICLSD